MEINEYALFWKCEGKLDKVLHNRDSDLRVLVGHSNMLQSLMTALAVKYRHDPRDDATSFWYCEEYDDKKWEDPDPSTSHLEYAEELDPIDTAELVENSIKLSHGSPIVEKKIPSGRDQDGSCGLYRKRTDLYACNFAYLA
jgi:hypothetical protein